MSNPKFATIIYFFTLALLTGALFSGASAQTTAFTYQGKLTDTANPANGSYDFEFRLFDTAGVQQGPVLSRPNVTVTSGIFSVSLDFGLLAFDTVSRRTLEIAVRPAGGGTFTTLSPRQPITSAPVAIRAVNSTNSENSAALGGLAPSQYVQTTDPRLTDSRVPVAGSFDYIQNSLTPQNGATNFNISGNGTIGGTLQAFNASVSNNATVQNNLNVLGTISGNGSGLTSLNATSITNGTLSDSLLSANVPRTNSANFFTANQTVSGNLFVNGIVTLSGALTSFFNSDGFVASGTFGSGAIPATGAGTRMMFYPRKAAFRAGRANSAGGSQWNDVNIGNFSFAVGDSTTASGISSVAAGFLSTASGNYSVALGFNTAATGDNSTAMGNNAVSGGLISTAIGFEVVANGDYSTALGYSASTNNQPGSFVYGDNSTLNKVNATSANQFVVRASGGFRFRTNSALTTGCDLPAGSGVFSCTSSRTLKENFASVDGRQILGRLRLMPVGYWNYIGEKPGVRHLGVFAEDFYSAFGLGTDNRSIGLLDIAGVNLAATKALDERVEAASAEIDAQRQRIEAQQRMIEKQQKQIEALIRLVCGTASREEVCQQLRQ